MIKLIKLFPLFVLFSACATKIHKVDLMVNPQAEKSKLLLVKDNRLDTQLYLNGISFNSQSHIYFIETAPSLSSAIENLVLDKISPTTSKYTKINISINLVDLKNKIGFGKEDELLCQIESSLSAETVKKSKINKSIRTIAKNTKNLSPLVTTAAKTILDQCLNLHATDILNELKGI